MNYVLEGGKDFNASLMELLCAEADETHETCPISGGTLATDHVRLACSHTFNPSAILLEVKRQKTTYSSLERQKLGKYELKCPYCRAVQKGVLPYREGDVKIEGVNWPPAKVHKGHKCSAVLKTGKRAGQRCNRPSVCTLCRAHKGRMVAAVPCEAILKSGGRKGEQCACQARHKAVNSLNETVLRLCGKHIRGKDNRKYTIVPL